MHVQRCCFAILNMLIFLPFSFNFRRSLISRPFDGHPTNYDFRVFKSFGISRITVHSVLRDRKVASTFSLFLGEIFEKVSFDPYNFRITRLSAEQMKSFQGIKIYLYLPFKDYNTFNNATLTGFELNPRWAPLISAGIASYYENLILPYSLSFKNQQCGKF